MLTLCDADMAHSTWCVHSSLGCTIYTFPKTDKCAVQGKLLRNCCTNELADTWPHATPCSSVSRRNVHTSYAAHMQGYISSVAVVPSVSMNLSSSEEQMLETYRASLEHWGWRWTACGPHAASVLLTHFGSVLDVSMNAVDLQVCVVLLCFMAFAAWWHIWVCYTDCCCLLPAVLPLLSSVLCYEFDFVHRLNVLQC